MSNFMFDPKEEDRVEEVLPNGYTRGEYFQQGYSDFDIENWGLDQSGAPSPEAAGWVLMDMMDGDNDGVPDYLDKEANTPFPAYVDNLGQQIPDSILIEMQMPGEAIPRIDLEYYLLMARESDEKIKSRPKGVPLKFQEFDLDQDDYLSFDELLSGITRYFDFRTLLSLQDIYEMMEFYFIQE